MEVQYIYDEEGRQTGVIVPINLWNKMSHLVELDQKGKTDWDPSKYRGMYKDLKVDVNDDDLAEFTIELKRNNNIKLADALIAATALSNELVLVTRNKGDFAILSNLKIYNPFEADS